MKDDLPALFDLLKNALKRYKIVMPETSIPLLIQDKA
jgi:hypothetical protein